MYVVKLLNGSYVSYSSSWELPTLLICYVWDKADYKYNLSFFSFFEPGGHVRQEDMSRMVRHLPHHFRTLRFQLVLPLWITPARSVC